MRISDWSSDVCSSDLDVRRAQRGVPQDFDASALLAEGGEVGGDGFAGQVAAGILALARARGQVRGAVGLAGHGISLQVVHRCSAGAGQRDAATSWAGGLPGGVPRPTGTRRALTPRTCRSEEHTSELQSLMRISYAVFC